MDHIIWIKEGSWRILACYETRQEATQALQRLKRDGETVRYALRGGTADRSLRENVHQ